MTSRAPRLVRAVWPVVLVCLAGLVCLVAADARAVKFRRPFNTGIGLGHGFDNNYNAAGCTDWGCGGTCYNTHTGSDFPVGLGTDVVAGANGTVVDAFNGCDNYGYYGNPCGGKCGNYVRLQHADGSRTLYCHMKYGSLVVGKGQPVACGQKLGQSASSGSSTGPHVHFGWAPSGVSRDPFSGGCASGGAWVNQGAYPGFPVTTCEQTCSCNPGAQETQGCGLCGHRVRSCGGDCQWGGWSACQGQGPCSPGASDSGGCGNCGHRSRACNSACQWEGWSACSGEGPCAAGSSENEACCTCGSRSRACSATCQWAEWSSCAGPDPVGAPACDTGLLGDCGQGALRCLAGCLACTQTVFPTPERCDDHDTDCDGEVDEDATELGEPPAALAAQLMDLSVPDALATGELAWVWARFRNVGTTAWPPGRAWLAAQELGGAPSPLWVAADDVGAGWSAFDAAAVLHQWTGVGDEVTLAFSVRMPLAASPGSRFTLVFDGQAMRCPSPGFDVKPGALAPSPFSEPAAQPTPAEGEQLPRPEQSPDPADSCADCDGGYDSRNQGGDDDLAPPAGADPAPPAGADLAADAAQDTGSSGAASGCAPIPARGSSLRLPLLLLMLAVLSRRRR